MHCELPCWQALDDVKATVECMYCGALFGVTDQLRDQDWAYRRSAERQYLLLFGVAQDVAHAA